MSTASKLSCRIVKDENADNPCMDEDFLSNIITFSREFDFGNCQEYSTPKEFQDFRNVNPDENMIWPIYMNDLKVVSLPHNDLSSEADTDSNNIQVGWAFVPIERAKAEFPKTNGDALKNKAFAVLKSEIDLLNKYVSGECFGYEIVDEDEDVIDSELGFYGFKEADKAGKLALKKARAEARLHGNNEKCFQCGDKWHKTDMKWHDEKLYCPICHACLTMVKK
jgi:hypothetical protein